jgi:hypothetical protein
MKEYPKILGPYDAAHGQPCIAFYKLDGSNLRFEWNPKSGWYKFGTRRQLFHPTDPVYGSAVEIFLRKYGDGLIKVIRENSAYRKVDGLIAYAEFFGPHSFAGKHDAEFLGVESNDPKDVVLFDININKKGFVSPEKFVEHFGHLHIPEVVYRGPFDRDFTESIRNNTLGVPLVEGVVAKGGEGHKLWMRKVKTLAYLKELKERLGTGWEQYWE